MEDAQENPNPGQEVMDSVGMNAESEPQEGGETAPYMAGQPDPLYVQKRLKQQKRAHERELRELHGRINDMQSMLTSNQNPQANGDSYPSQGGVDEQIQRAVTYALQHKEMEERSRQEAQMKQHVAKQYQELDRHLDNAADEHEDFDEVVRGDTPFTPHMRDAALMLPRKGPGSAAEVLYKLGKNPDELKRIGRLHPLEQAQELNRLSHALVSSKESNSFHEDRMMGQIKSNPVISRDGITDKSSVSDIRKILKAGWK